MLMIVTYFVDYLSALGTLDVYLYQGIEFSIRFIEGTGIRFSVIDIRCWMEYLQGSLRVYRKVIMQLLTDQLKIESRRDENLLRIFKNPGIDKSLKNPIEKIEQFQLNKKQYY